MSWSTFVPSYPPIVPGVSRLVNEALPLQGKRITASPLRIASLHLFSVCFHRAFDMTQDAHVALQHLYSIPGITRVLTRYNDTPMTPDPVTPIPNCNQL